MIDFNNSNFIKLNQVNPSSVDSSIQPILVGGERIQIAAKGIRDYVVFTDKRIIIVNVQGMTGKKQDFTSLPYSKVQSFSIETAGTMDRDSELEVWFSGLGKVHLEFGSSIDIHAIARMIGSYIL